MARTTSTAIILATLLLFSVDNVRAAEAEPGVVSVSGSAEIRVLPDQVILTVGVESLSEDLETAKADNSLKVRQVIEAAKGQDVADQKIGTDFLRIQPEYDGRRKPEKPPVFVVQQSVVVTLSKIDRFEDLLSDVLAAGANYVHGIEFRTTKLREYRDEARRKAVLAAKEKGILLASELGLDVGEARRIQESGGRWWSSYGGSWGGRHTNFAAQNITQIGNQSGAEPGGSISPGEIAVSATVSVTFVLR